MGILVAGGEFRELDRVFYRVASIGLAVMAVSGAAFWLSVLAIHWAGSPYATRLLPPASTGVLLLGLQASLAVEFLWTYIHSHRVSPYLMLTVIGSVISAILIWWWGALFDRIGVAAAYFVVQGCIYLPLSIRIWNDFRQSRLLASVEPSGARSDA
jgi:hypothetical protein